MRAPRVTRSIAVVLIGLAVAGGLALASSVPASSVPAATPPVQSESQQQLADAQAMWHDLQNQLQTPDKAGVALLQLNADHPEVRALKPQMTAAEEAFSSFQQNTLKPVSTNEAELANQLMIAAEQHDNDRYATLRQQLEGIRNQLATLSKQSDELYRQVRLVRAQLGEVQHRLSTEEDRIRALVAPLEDREQGFLNQLHEAQRTMSATFAELARPADGTTRDRLLENLITQQHAINDLAQQALAVRNERTTLTQTELSKIGFGL